MAGELREPGKKPKNNYDHLIPAEIKAREEDYFQILSSIASKEELGWPKALLEETVAELVRDVDMREISQSTIYEREID